MWDSWEIAKDRNPTAPQSDPVAMELFLADVSAGYKGTTGPNLAITKPPGPATTPVPTPTAPVPATIPITLPRVGPDYRLWLLLGMLTILSSAASSMANRQLKLKKAAKEIHVA
jgi:hypothetical protein